MGHLLSWCMCLGFCREWSFRDCGCCYPALLWWSLLLLSWPQAGANGKPPLDEGAQGPDGATSSTDNGAKDIAFSAAHSSGSAVTEPEEFEVENEIVAEVRLAFCAWTHMWWWLLFLRGGGGGGGGRYQQRELTAVNQKVSLECIRDLTELTVTVLTLTWHVSRCKAHKLQQRYHLRCFCIGRLHIWKLAAGILS